MIATGWQKPHCGTLGGIADPTGKRYIMAELLQITLTLNGC
ncbi:MAG: hypothetical protein U5L01_06170 [Rheinheimera sp.]|nr:hypothetical protein [Rheinheimera sp.]